MRRRRDASAPAAEDASAPSAVGDPACGTPASPPAGQAASSPPTGDTSAADTVAKTRRYWVNTVSRDHVRRGVDGGFTQAGHGKASGLKRIANGDRIVFYSPRTALDGGEPLQAFTAIGTITDDAPFQVEMTSDFHPWRRKVAFATSEEAPIRPLIESLGFIRNKKSWGFVFRRGLFAIEERDFQTIERAMTIHLDAGTRTSDDTS